MSRNTAIIRTEDDLRTTLDDFKNGKFRTMVVIRKPIEDGFDHCNASVVAILRGCRSRIVFEQFIEHAFRTNLGAGRTERDVHATVISHLKYGQRRLVDAIDLMTLAKDEGDDDDDESASDEDA